MRPPAVTGRAAARRTRARRWRRGVATALALGLALPGCSRRPGAGGGEEAKRGARSADALAQVNGAALRDAELRQLIPPDLRESITGTEIREIIDRWVETELMYQKAMQEGLDRDPELTESLRQMQRQVLADEYLQRELKNRVRVSNEEILAYYRQHTDEYTQEVHIRHIVLNSSEEAEQVLQLLHAGGDFRTLARQYSVDASASEGGDLGFLGKGAMNPAFEPVVFQMAPNEVRGPIASSFGFHLVQVVERRPATEPVSFELARDEILQTLLLEKRQRATTEILGALRQGAAVRVAESYAGMSLVPGAAAARDTLRSRAHVVPGESRDTD